MNKQQTVRFDNPCVAEQASLGGKPVIQEYMRQLCKRGVIPATRPSRDWFIQAEDAVARLEQWLADANG